MTHHKRAVACIGVLASLLVSLVAHSGPYADDLSKCLVSSTTPADRATLVKWFFTAAALHPEVKSIATVTQVQIDEANKNVAALFLRLLTEACKSEAQKSLHYEGPSTFESAFSVLGQVAGRELFSSPEVSAGIAGLSKQLDSEKLKAALTLPEDAKN